MKEVGKLKNRRRPKRDRKHGFLEPKMNSFLIITEGEKTEPAYFNGLKSYILKNVGGIVDVVPYIDVHGEGRSTKRLLEAAERIIKSSKVFYQNICLVFDKDDFMDFDSVIVEIESRGYEVAWSNQCFEYWIYLHFEYSDAPLHRKGWEQKLEAQFKKYKLSGGSYNKNDERLFSLLKDMGKGDEIIRKAIKNGERRMSGFSKEDRPSAYNPGTTVHKLVEKLISFIK